MIDFYDWFTELIAESCGAIPFNQIRLLEIFLFLKYICLEKIARMLLSMFPTSPLHCVVKTFLERSFNEDKEQTMHKIKK